MNTVVKIKKLSERARIPQYGSDFAAGADLYALTDGPVTVSPSETVMIKTGIALEIPEGYAGLIYARSGLASKKGLAPANKVGVVDSDYRGEIAVGLCNLSDEPFTIRPGDRIAQLVVTPCPPVSFLPAEELSETERGAGGFGSSGR